MKFLEKIKNLFGTKEKTPRADICESSISTPDIDSATLNENDFFTLLSKVLEKKQQYTVPDFDLPILPKRMERDMEPKLVSFDSYLCSIANSYKRLSHKQKMQARKLKLASSPASIRFEWKK